MINYLFSYVGSRHTKTVGLQRSSPTVARPSDDLSETSDKSGPALVE